MGLCSALPQTLWRGATRPLREGRASLLGRPRSLPARLCFSRKCRDGKRGAEPPLPDLSACRRGRHFSPPCPPLRKMPEGGRQAGNCPKVEMAPGCSDGSAGVGSGPQRAEASAQSRLSGGYVPVTQKLCFKSSETGPFPGLAYIRLTLPRCSPLGPPLVLCFPYTGGPFQPTRPPGFSPECWPVTGIQWPIATCGGWGSEGCGSAGACAQASSGAPVVPGSD